MKKLIYQFIACAAALPLAAYLLPGVDTVNYEVAVLAGASLALLYFVLRPVARLLLGVFNLLTLGLVGLIIDASLVYMVPVLFPGGFYVKDFLWAIAAAAIVDAVRAIAGRAARR